MPSNKQPRPRSAEPFISTEESRGALLEHISGCIRESNEITLSRLYTALEISQKALLSNLDDRLASIPGEVTSAIQERHELAKGPQ